MRFASQGHNRDVVFGVLLGQDCDEQTARHIAESVVALHESRQAPARDQTEDNEPAEETAESAKSDETGAANPLGALWFPFFNTLRF